MKKIQYLGHRALRQNTKVTSHLLLCYFYNFYWGQLAKAVAVEIKASYENIAI